MIQWRIMQRTFFLLDLLYRNNPCPKYYQESSHKLLSNCSLDVFPLYICTPVSFSNPKSLVLHSIFPQSSQVYYCLLEAGSDRSDSAGRDTRSTESGLTSPLRVDSKRQYVICFATIGKTGLDLYPYHLIVNE